MMTFIKRRLKSELSWQIRDRLCELSPSLMQWAAFRPHEGGSYTEPAFPVADTTNPVPPRELWAGYGTSPEGYLQTGRDDTTTLRRLLAESGFDVSKSK